MLATGNKLLSAYRLSIRFGADGFSFSVLNALDGSVVQTDRFAVPRGERSAEVDVLREALRKPYLMDYHFQGVELVAEAPGTIIPLEQFSKGDMLAFYRLCYPRQQAGVADMQYQVLSSVEAVMVFPLDQDVLRAVRECYPDVRVCHSDALLLERFAARQQQRPAAEDAEQRDVYVSVGEQGFFACVFFRARLLYAAAQPALNDADRTFLLLGIWKALDLQAQRDALHLGGASKALGKTLSEYILNITEE